MDRRQGDLDSYYADPGLAFRELNWKATKNLEDMCESSKLAFFICLKSNKLFELGRDLWNWTVKNPTGFAQI